MNLALYMDENVPEAITAGLRLREVDVLTVQEDGLAGYSDRIIAFLKMMRCSNNNG